MPSIFAGAVEIDITPPIGTELNGYVRQSPSQGVHDPLKAAVIVLQAADQKLVLIGLDLLGIELALAGRVRAAVAAALGMPAAGVMISCIHTHSGPAGFLPDLPGMPTTPDPLLQESLARALTGAAKSAAARMEPARVGVSRGELFGLGANRNDPQRGPYDPQVTVLKVEAADGRLLAALVNYGCHPTVLSGDNLLISADYPGASRFALQALYPGAVILFANGAAGDISTRFTRRGQGFPEVERMGRLLAGEVLKLLQTAEMHTDAALAAVDTPIHIPLRTFPSLNEMKANAAYFKAELERLTASGAPQGEIRKLFTRVQGAEMQITQAAKLAGRKTQESVMQALRVGPLFLVSMPGEVFTSIALAVKAEYPAEYVAVISYANDYQGYFLDAAALGEGSYESLVSPYDARAGELLRGTALELLGRLHAA